LFAHRVVELRRGGMESRRRAAAWSGGRAPSALLHSCENRRWSGSTPRGSSPQTAAHRDLPEARWSRYQRAVRSSIRSQACSLTMSRASRPQELMNLVEDAWDGRCGGAPAGNHGVEWPSIREPLQEQRLKEIPSRRVGSIALTRKPPSASALTSSPWPQADAERRWPSSSAAGCAPSRASASRTGHGAAFRAPGGRRLAVYELTRPRAGARLGGWHDFGRGSG